jgi:hypothetical protein
MSGCDSGSTADARFLFAGNHAAIGRTGTSHSTDPTAVRREYLDPLFKGLGWEEDDD